MNFLNSFFGITTEEKRVQHNMDNVIKKGKKGKERKNWENNSSIWQGRKRK